MIDIHNGDKTVRSAASVVVRPQSIEDVIEVTTERDRFPSPVRPVGSNMSTTPCNSPDGGALVDMSGKNSIIEVGGDRVKAEAPSRSSPFKDCRWAMSPSVWRSS